MAAIFAATCLNSDPTTDVKNTNMPTYQEFQAQFAVALTKCVTLSTQDSEAVSPQALLAALINALPYYANPNFMASHRAALVNLLEVYMPNNGISPQGSDNGFGYATSYAYTGSCSGYQNAFFGGASLTATAAAVSTQVQEAAPALNNAWWGSYGVTALTDAIRISISASLNTNKLATDLSNNNTVFLSALTASYLGVYTTGYQPTAAALAAITSTNQSSPVASLLVAAIVNGQFTANINQVISTGGDSTAAATWFLYNLWVTLKALGADINSVNATIISATTAGLNVPSQVGPSPLSPSPVAVTPYAPGQGWWSGGYTSWYIALSGNDVSPQAAATITSVLPQESTTYTTDSRGIPSNSPANVTNGYSQSLCYWGGLNWYNPPSSSCFGKGTQVLMPDGSTRAIETIMVGDTLQSSLGNKKVVMVETPKRVERSLYQINGLKVFVTAAHPFQAGQREKGMHVAIDPWAAMDYIPSMMANGISKLCEGSLIAGLVNGQPSVIQVTNMTEYPTTDNEDRVYDLILENYAAYFVGSDSNFLATDTESINPSFDLPGTVAIASAMYATIDSCRENFPHPDNGRHMIQAIHSLPFTPTPFSIEDSALPQIPRPAFYMQDGQWDAYASHLETHLIRSHSRNIRRHLSNPLVNSGKSGEPKSHHGICVRDIELLGEFGVTANSALSLELRWVGLDSEQDVVETVSLGTSNVMRWFIIYDGMIHFNSPLPANTMIHMSGSLMQNGFSLGRFRLDSKFSVTALNQVHFIFNDAGKIIGRIALDEIHIDDHPETNKDETLFPWKSEPLHSAASLGRQLGRKLNQISNDFKRKLASTREIPPK